MNKKPGILIITFCIPWPVADGGKVYVYTSVNYLRRFYDITLLLSVYNQADADHVAHLNALWPDVKIEMVSYIKHLSPKQKLKKTGLQLYNALFSKKGNETGTHIFFNLRKKITNIFLLSPNFLSVCEKLLTANSYDIVQVEYSTNIGAINFIPRNTIKIFVEIESLYSIMSDYMAVQGDNSFINTYLVNTAKHIELDFMKRYDALLALNEADRKRLEGLFPGKKVFTSPYAAPDKEFGTAEAMNTWEPLKLIFSGSENHYPNKDGVEWFIKEVMPLLQNQLLQLFITGFWSNAFKAQYSTDKNVVFTGFVENLSEVMKDSIMVIPIRLGGGGIRAKLIQAMAFGIPIITTSLGSTGVAAQDGENMFVRDDAAGFASAIDQLYAQRDKGLNMLKASNKLAAEQFSELAAGQLRHSYYQQLLHQKQS